MSIGLDKISIGIIGTRGIPNRYGGFEKMVELLAPWLQENNCDVTVYCPKKNPDGLPDFKGVHLEYCFNPEKTLGTIGQFIYDLICNLRSRKNKHDVILHFGYTSDSIWGFLWSKKSYHITNMDGMEWKRTKYGRFTQRFLKYAEKLAVKHSNKLVADHPEIAKYLKIKYPKAEISTISYPVTIPVLFEIELLGNLNLKPQNYFLAIARFEPENNLEMICEAFVKSNSDKKLVLVGALENPFSKNLQEKFSSKIIFAGPIYESKTLDALKYYSAIYIHGHSVGGTNPSLLEAMACQCNIVAHNNPFNTLILSEDALFFDSSAELSNILISFELAVKESKRSSNLEKVKKLNTIDFIGKEYLKLMIKN